MAKPLSETAQEAAEPWQSAAAVAASITAKLDRLEGSFMQLTGSLQEQVQDSQQQTLEHLLLYEAAVGELQLSAAEASAAHRDLLATCRQLGEGLRGVDLLAGRVAAVRAAVESLEAQVEAVAAGAGGGRRGAS